MEMVRTGWGWSITVRKISKIVAATLYVCQILRRTKFDFCWGYAQIAAFKGAYLYYF